MTGERTGSMQSCGSCENVYNPYKHRTVDKPTSDGRSFANLLKASLGTGILAIPLAFSYSGWAVGIVGTVIISFICAHCVHIFVKISYECCVLDRQPLMGYADTCKSAFSNGPKFTRPWARFARIFAECSLLFTYLGVCCIFTVLLADSIKQITDQYFPSTIWKVEYYCLILMVPLCFIAQVRHLKYLAISSQMANVLLFTTFLICLYYVFKDKINFSERHVVGRPWRFPAFLSTVIFAMEGIGQVMPIENAMKKPQHFPKVLLIAMALITILYATLGLFGYLRYGDVLHGSITLNLPMDDWPAICAKCFIGGSIFLTYPLHFYVVTDVLNRHSDGLFNEQYKNIAQVAMRCFIVLFCGSIGIALPFLEQIINIVGALFYSTLGLIIPGVVETVFRWDNLGRFNWILWKNALIVLFGFSCLISGCLISLMEIVDKLNSKIE